MRGLIEFNGNTAEGLRFWFWTAACAVINGAILFAHATGIVLAWKMFS